MYDSYDSHDNANRNYPMNAVVTQEIECHDFRHLVVANENQLKLISKERIKNEVRIESYTLV